MRGSVVVGAFELQHDLTGAVECQPLIGDGGSGDIPTEVFQFMTLVEGEPHLGMQAKAPLVDTALRCGRRHSVRDGLQGQYFLPGARPECDAVGYRPPLAGVSGRSRGHGRPSTSSPAPQPDSLRASISA
jgi:hypothetical protein